MRAMVTCFRVNPLGAQQDGLILDGAKVRTDWDGLWVAAAYIDQRGWTAELAIPFICSQTRRLAPESGAAHRPLQ
jgi:hypothetical protein